MLFLLFFYALENNRNQVVSTTLEEFDQELYEKIIRDEGREEGHIEGIKEGIEEGRRLERESTERDRLRAEAAEKEIERLKKLLEEK